MFNIVTTDALVSPATAQQLIDWSKLDSDDPNIESSLLVATRLVISFLSLELLPRTYALTYEDWPTIGTAGGSKLSMSTCAYKSRVDLPYANLLSITSVTADGEVLTTDDYRILPGKPYQIDFDSIYTSNDDNPALEVVYSAGYGAASADVPEPIIQAIVMCAGYIHSHAGGCDTGNALKASGASEILTPYAVTAGIAI